MIGITKNFPGVVANHNVDFDLYPSEIHSILGENGAGKTTLMKILAGMHQPEMPEQLSSATGPSKFTRLRIR